MRRQLDAFVALPDRIRLPLAIVLALLVHALIVLASVLIPAVPKSNATAQATPKQQLQIILSTPAPAPEPQLTAQEEKALEEKFTKLPPEERRDYVDVDGLAAKKNMSKRALLESWQDSVAGTRKQGKDDAPSQDGREDLTFTNFKNQQAKTGDVKDTAPIFKPQPITKPELDTAQQKLPRVAEAAPTKQPTSTPTPAPVLVAKASPPPNLKSVAEARADEIPLFIRQPAAPPATTPPPPAPTIQPTPVQRPTASPLPTAQPEAKKIESVIATQLPRPKPVQNPGYSPHLEQRKIEGSSATLGDSGVDAAASVRGGYIKSVNQIVGSRWTHYVHDTTQGSLISTGSVTIHFVLNEHGKIVRMQVTDNTSNSAYATLCERSIREAQTDLIPPPKELLKNGIFEDNLTFTLY